VSRENGNLGVNEKSKKPRRDTQYDVASHYKPSLVRALSDARVSVAQAARRGFHLRVLAVWCAGGGKQQHAFFQEVPELPVPRASRRKSISLLYMYIYICVYVCVYCVV
jgi:hypothetical protein